MYEKIGSVPMNNLMTLLIANDIDKIRFINMKSNLIKKHIYNYNIYLFKLATHIVWNYWLKKKLGKIYIIILKMDFIIDLK